MDMRKKLPRICDNKMKCCGCSVCSHSCPVGAITMIIDSEGFLYPNINANKCIYCYKCEQVCIYVKDN